MLDTRFKFPGAPRKALPVRFMTKLQGARFRSWVMAAKCFATARQILRISKADRVQYPTLKNSHLAYE
jgi:hypothetical protein